MVRLFCCALSALLPLLYLSCGGSGEPPKTADTEPSFEEGAEPDEGEPNPDEAEPEGAHKTPAPIKTTGAPLPEGPNDFEVTYRDCLALHSNYKKLLRQDEMQKLEKKKLPPKVYKGALIEVEKIIKDGAKQWLETCEGIVNTVQVRPRWQCAQDAETIERFNGCMDGKFDDEFK